MKLIIIILIILIHLTRIEFAWHSKVFVMVIVLDRVLQSFLLIHLKKIQADLLQTLSSACSIEIQLLTY